MVYKELELLPDYTPCYVIEQFKEYLGEETDSKYKQIFFKCVLAAVNYEETRKKITENQAIELNEILMRIK